MYVTGEMGLCNPEYNKVSKNFYTNSYFVTFHTSKSNENVRGLSKHLLVMSH